MQFVIFTALPDLCAVFLDGIQ